VSAGLRWGRGSVGERGSISLQEAQMALQRGTVRVLLAIAVLGAGVWLWGDLVFLTAEERAVKTIEKLGGEGIREEEQVPGSRVVGVSLIQAKDLDAGLKQLKALNDLTNLQELYLCNTQVTDEGLKELRELKSLKMLDLGFTQVTDEGLKELKDLK